MSCFQDFAFCGILENNKKKTPSLRHRTTWKIFRKIQKNGFQSYRGQFLKIDVLEINGSSLV